MAGYTVEIFDGPMGPMRWRPKDGVTKLQSLFRASVETFEARLRGFRSRIRQWPGGDVVAEVPAKALYVSPQDVYRKMPAIRKALGLLGD